MFNQQRNINSLVRITATLSVVVMLLFFASCRQNRDFVGLEFDPELVPSMITIQVNTLISDSGITRYRLAADVWKVFDRAAEPHWFFPEGIHLEQFDSLFHVESTVTADTAWNFTAKHLWQLTGNVQVENREGTRFTTEELFWNQTEGRFFGNQFMEVITADGLEIRGFGFTSNQDMTDYRITHPVDNRIPVVDNQPPARRFNEAEENENVQDNGGLDAVEPEEVVIVEEAESDEIEVTEDAEEENT